MAKIFLAVLPFPLFHFHTSSPSSRRRARRSPEPPSRLALSSRRSPPLRHVSVTSPQSPTQTRDTSVLSALISSPDRAREKKHRLMPDWRAPVIPGAGDGDGDGDGEGFPRSSRLSRPRLLVGVTKVVSYSHLSYLGLLQTTKCLTGSTIYCAPA